jgi:hypothetical protein
MTIIGMIAIGIVSAGARFAGHRFGQGIHLRDPSLVRMEENYLREREDLRAIAAREPETRAKSINAEPFLRERIAAFERAVLALEGVGVASGLEVVGRPPARDFGRWVTSGIRFRAGRTASELAEALAGLELPDGSWVEDLRCDAGGCRIAVSAAALKPEASPRFRSGPSTARALPPKPWWPPDASRWERVRELREEISRLRATVNEVGTMRAAQREGESLDALLRALGSDWYRAEILDCLAAARAAGLSEFGIRRADTGIEIAVTRRDEMDAQLSSRGFEEVSSRAEAGTTYVRYRRHGGPARSTDFVFGLPVGTSPMR